MGTMVCSFGEGATTCPVGCRRGALLLPRRESLLWQLNMKQARAWVVQ